MRLIFLTTFISLLAVQCRTYNPHTAFDPKKTPAAPNYASRDSWAALPDRLDAADVVAGTQAKDMQSTAEVDVFFLYPTTLLGNRRGNDKMWNADIKDAGINKSTDEKPIQYQASAFNGAGRVYAPRYRQAHLYSFYSKDKISSAIALDTAYTDVKAAFKYYLEHWNEGRPFMIAAHSQGARHAMYLLRDEIEGTPIAQQLVAAYIVGWPVNEKFFKETKPCLSPEQTGCYCSWRTYERKYGLKNAIQDDVVCTNPILWTIEQKEYAPKSMNEGAVVRGFEKIYTNLCDAEVYRGVLLCTKPKFPGSALLRTKNYHPGDINLYYFNVRNNAELRGKMFLKR